MPFISIKPLSVALLCVLSLFLCLPVAGATDVAPQTSYTSLTAEIISAHALASNKNLNDYMATIGVGIAVPSKTYKSDLTTDQLTASIAAPTVLGRLDSASLGMTSTQLSATTLTDLTTQLQANNVGITSSDMASIDSLTKAVQLKAADWDAIVTRAGAQWTAQLGTLATPTLPKAKTVKASIPKNALPFGLLLDKSLTEMIKNSPNMVAVAKKSGLASATTPADWQKAMNSAWANSQKDLMTSVPDPCTGQMLTTMATGKVTGTGCSPGCAIGGQYLHSQAQGLFSPTRVSALPNPTADVWNAATVNSLPTWVRQTIDAQNPSLATISTSETDSCTAASTAATATASSALPTIFDSLLK